MKYTIRVSIAAVAYAAVLIIFQYGFDLEDTNIRLATFLAPVLGIMWGSPAAIGIGIGNFISDIFSGGLSSFETTVTTILGSVGNAMIAFFSYMLWRTAFLHGQDDDPFVVSVKNIIRYILIQLIVSVATSLYIVIISTGRISLYFESAWDFVLIIMLNNWEVNILLGLPILLMLMSTNYDFYNPESRNILNIDGKFFDTFLATLVISSAVFVSLDVKIFDDLVNFRRIFALFFLLYLLRPVPQINRRKSSMAQPIYYRIAKGFCLFMVCLTLIESISSFLSMDTYSTEEMWMGFYKDTFMIMHFSLAIQLVLIWYIEVNIVKPLTRITKTAEQFISSDLEKEKIEFEVVRSGDEIELLSTTLQRMLNSIYKYIDDLRRTLSERAKTNTQLEIAMNIQASLLPSPKSINEQFNKIRLDTLMHPALMIGGDFYDFKALDDDHIFIVVSDISDKGIPAALFMTITHTLIHHKISIEENISLPKIFSETNNQLCENNETEMFATAVGVIYEVSTGKLIYVNAGHTSPLVVHGDGTTEFLKKRSGAMLGSIEDMPYKKLETKLSTGDILILYSDGVTEALNEREEFFLEERLSEVMTRFVKENKTDNVANYLRNEISKFVGSHPQSDDITIVALNVFDAP